MPGGLTANIDGLRSAASTADSLAGALQESTELDRNTSVQPTVLAVQSTHAVIAAARQDQTNHLESFAASLRSAASAYQDADNGGAQGIGNTV